MDNYNIKKYYAVVSGKVPGIYVDLELANEQVNRVKGSRFKSFKDLKEAMLFMERNGHDYGKLYFEEEAFIDMNKLMQPDKGTWDKIDNLVSKYIEKDEEPCVKPVKNFNLVTTLEYKSKSLKDYSITNNNSILSWNGTDIDTKPINNTNSCTAIGSKEHYLISENVVNGNKLVIYTDGSHFNENKVGWAAIILPNNKYGIDRLHKLYGRSPDIQANKKYKNIYAEILAIVKSVNYLQEKYGTEIDVLIYHDFSGVELWAKQPLSNNKLSNAYKMFIQDKTSLGMKFYFAKVDSHSGDILNNLADRYARKAADELKLGEVKIEL